MTYYPRHSVWKKRSFSGTGPRWSSIHLGAKVEAPVAADGVVGDSTDAAAAVDVAV